MLSALVLIFVLVVVEKYLEHKFQQNNVCVCNVQSCFVNKIQCCCCLLKYKKSHFCFELRAVGSELPGSRRCFSNYLSCSTTKGRHRHRYLHSHPHTHTHTDTCAYNYFVYICMATHTDRARDRRGISVKHCNAYTQCVPHLHSQLNFGSSADSRLGFLLYDILLTTVICCHVMS